MGNAASPNLVLEHAIERGSARSVDIAAITCERIPVDQALAICLIYMLEQHPKWPRASARLLERLVSETRCSIGVAATLATALAGGRSTLPALAASLDGLGLARAASRAEAVVQGRRPLV